MATATVSISNKEKRIKKGSDSILIKTIKFQKIEEENRIAIEFQKIFIFVIHEWYPFILKKFDIIAPSHAVDFKDNILGSNIIICMTCMAIIGVAN